LAGLDVNDGLELGGILDRQIAYLRAVQDAVDIGSCNSPRFGGIRSVSDQPALTPQPLRVDFRGSSVIQLTL
jgi:hypothetical protein